MFWNVIWSYLYIYVFTIFIYIYVIIYHITNDVEKFKKSWLGAFLISVSVNNFTTFTESTSFYVHFQLKMSL